MLLPAKEAAHVPSPSLCTPLDKSWAHSFSAQSHWCNLSWKTRANSFALIVLLPANETIAQYLHTTWQVLGTQFFGTFAVMQFVLKTRASSYTFPLYRFLPTDLSPSHFPRFPFHPPCHRFHLSPFPRISPHKLLPTASPPSILSSLPCRSFPTELSPSYFPRFSSVHLVVASVSLPPNGAQPMLFPTLPLRPPWRRFRTAPSQRSSPQPIPHASPPSTLSSLPYRSFPTGLSPCYFPRFPLRPPCRRFRIAPSPRTLPILFPTVSPQFTLSSLPYRSFPMELSPSYFRWFPSSTLWSFPYRSFPTGLSPSYFPRLPFPSTLSSLPYRSFPMELSPWVSRPSTLSPLPYIAPSQQSSPHFPRFPSRSPSRPFRVSLLPNGALPLFPTLSFPSTLLSLPSRSFPTELSPCYFLLGWAACL